MKVPVLRVGIDSLSYLCSKGVIDYKSRRLLLGGCLIQTLLGKKTSLNIICG